MPVSVRSVTGVSVRAVVAIAVAATAGLVAGVQLRNGVLPTWDTVSYWSGAEAIRAGDLFGSNLQPSFSNFTVIEFLERGGRLPFVDFPVGYPILIAAVGLLTGTHTAMAVWTVAGCAAFAGLICWGPTLRPVTPAMLATRAAIAIGLVVTSPMRVVTRAGMSEPLFCAIAIGLILALLDFRRTGRRWPLVIALAVAAGMLRFVGASLVVLVVAERWRRTRSAKDALGWGAVAIAPAVANAWWASRAGGGHSARLHAISGLDVERFSRSVGGWIDARHANIALTFFSNEGARWWTYPLAVIWIAAALSALVTVIVGPARRLPAELELCLAASALLAIGLVAGMLGFDALVNPDNRVMLPLGVLTLTGLAWTATPATGRYALAGASAWLLAAVVPRGATDPYLPTAAEPATVAVAEASGASAIVTPDADLLHWYSGLPAAYPPKAYLELTDEHIDIDAQWDALACAMLDADAVLLVPGGNLMFGLDARSVEQLVTAGELLPEPHGDITVFRPTPSDCAPLDE